MHILLRKDPQTMIKVLKVVGIIIGNVMDGKELVEYLHVIPYIFLFVTMHSLHQG